MTTQSPNGRYQVFSAKDYHTRYPSVVPAGSYDSLQDAIAHAESVTYKMAVIDDKAESRGFIYCNWETESAPGSSLGRAKILQTMAIAASSGTNRVWQGEWRRSEFASPYAWAESLRWAPQQDKYGKWSAMYLVASVAGPTQTIDGNIVNAPPTGMWSGCSLCERFDTEADCIAWMTAQGIYVPQGWESVTA